MLLKNSHKLELLAPTLITEIYFSEHLLILSDIFMYLWRLMSIYCYEFFCFFISLKIANEQDTINEKDEIVKNKYILKSTTAVILGFHRVIVKGPGV
jgi:hypothetical protein